MRGLIDVPNIGPILMDPNFASDMDVGHGFDLDLRRLPIRLHLHAKDFVALAEST